MKVISSVDFFSDCDKLTFVFFVMLMVLRFTLQFNFMVLHGTVFGFHLNH
jgi:hypothetical protein